VDLNTKQKAESRKLKAEMNRLLTTDYGTTGLRDNGTTGLLITDHWLLITDLRQLPSYPTT